MLSHRPGKQEEKAAKPPNRKREKGEKERDLVIIEKTNIDMTSGP